MNRTIRINLASIALSPLLLATTNTSWATNVTIYKDFAVVQDTLELTLQSGSNEVTHYDITRQLEPSSVILSAQDPNITLIINEQNYLATPLDQARLLEMYEGQEIEFKVRFNDHDSVQKGTILRAGKPGAAHTSAQEVMIEMDGQLRFGLPGTPVFPALVDHSLLKPQLSWKLSASQAGEMPVNLSYLTQGFGWNAAYNFVQTSDNTLTAAGWLTIENTSGKDFSKSQLKLVAGDVNKINPAPEAYNRRVAKVMMADSVDSGVTEKAVDEFHLYTVPGELDLRTGETKQVQFLAGQGIRYHTDYVYDGARLPYGYDAEYVRTQRDFGAQSKTDVEIFKVVENKAENGLGKPLPEGTIRFYDRDTDGALIFVGENRIAHTPKDETLRIFTGNAFDLKGERKQTDFSVNNSSRSASETIEITLKNRKDSDATFKVVEHLYRGPNHQITSQENWTEDDATTMHLNVLVPANSEKTITYSVNYRW